MPTKQDILDFENPTGYLFSGSYIVQLTKLPPAARTELNKTGQKGNVLKFDQGCYEQQNRHFDFYHPNYLIMVGVKLIKYITDADGNLLWVNDDHKRRLKRKRVK